MVDLHTHSNISDGDFSPDLLIKEAVRQSLRAIALTDHDTINGLECAEKAAAEVQDSFFNKNGAAFRFIPGIEIEINAAKLPYGMARPGPGGEFHLLGLGIKAPTAHFIDAIDKLALRREARNREILDRMHELSIEATWDEFLSLCGGNTPGRPHFAKLLVKHKIVRNVNQAFARYLGTGKPLYVPKDGMVFEEAVAIIRESGGIPVLAHPVSLYVAWGRLPDLIKTLKEMGLMGLEAWHPNTKPGSCRRLEALGRSLDLYITEGSDFHGCTRPDRKIGYSGKNRKISDAVLEAIPELAGI
ncbi:MAG: PHP domain-containing protein [Treponema sp.]|jgi:predicted metal-dependent phosphoesterase TrpH|nr:PHP domain-containing protein [Treponema sp.]